MPQKLLVLFLLMAGLAAACTAQPSPVPSPMQAPMPAPTGPAPAPTRTFNTPDPSPTPLGPDLLAVYLKTGCFTGVRETLLVRPDGRLEWSDYRSSKQAQWSLEKLNGILADPALRDVQPLYAANGADLCVYRVTARLPDGRTIVSTTMDAAAPPPVLSRLVAELENLRRLASQ